MDARTLWHTIRRAGGATLPRRPVAPVHHAINARAPYGEILRRYARGGFIGCRRAGMDCDCTQYESARVVPAPAGALLFEREESIHADWLDGPESTSWARPEDITPGYRSRDRALEAFEDGHPGTVYMGPMDD